MYPASPQWSQWPLSWKDSHILFLSIKVTVLWFDGTQLCWANSCPLLNWEKWSERGELLLGEWKGRGWDEAERSTGFSARLADSQRSGRRGGVSQRESEAKGGFEWQSVQTPSMASGSHGANTLWGLESPMKCFPFTVFLSDDPVPGNSAFRGLNIDEGNSQHMLFIEAVWVDLT